MKVKLTKTMYIEAAHRNPAGGEAQARMHGHSYRVDLLVAGDVTSDVGWLIDYGDIKRLFEPLYGQLDHHCLNEVEGMGEPTVNGLRRWIFDRLKPELPGLEDVKVAIAGDLAFQPVELPFDPVLTLPPRWRFTVEAAQYLPQLPKEHKCTRLHGHSYRIEAGAKDLARLKPLLMEIHDELDHRCLNDIAGLERATCEIIAAWIWRRLAAQVDDLTVVVVRETDTASCIYFGPGQGGQ